MERMNSTALKAVLHSSIVMSASVMTILDEKHNMDTGKRVLHIICSLFGGLSLLDLLLLIHVEKHPDGAGLEGQPPPAKVTPNTFNLYNFLCGT